MGFDPVEYEAQYLKPLRRATSLPDDLIRRYAIPATLPDAEVAGHLRTVRAFWNKKAGGQAGVATICRLCRNADEDLQRQHPDMGTAAFWDRCRQQSGESAQRVVTEIAAELTSSFGPFGVIVDVVLDDMAGTWRADAAQMRAAAKLAGLDVRPPVAVPTSSPIAAAQYSSLKTAFIESGDSSFVQLVLPGCVGYSLVSGFRSKDPDQRLDARAVEQIRHAVDRAGTTKRNTARKSAITVLVDHVGRGGDVATLEVYRLAQLLGEHRGASLSRRVDVLAQTGVDRCDAALIAMSVGASTQSGADAVVALLADGELLGARAALTVLDADERARVTPQVEAAERRVEELRAGSAAALHDGREATAWKLLHEAAAIAADDAALANELTRIPLPPPARADVAVDQAKVTVLWTAGERQDASTRYLVVRKERTAPVDHRDGVIVHDGRGATTVDATAPVARDLHYAICAVTDDGVASRPARARATVLPEPANVRTHVAASSVEVTWSLHHGADHAVVRAIVDGGAPRDVPVRANVAQLSGLTEGRPVVVEVRAVYRDAGGGTVHSEPVVTAVTPRGPAQPLPGLGVAPVDSATGCRVRVSWHPLDHSEVRIRHAAEAPPWSCGDVVTREQLEGYGVEVSGALMTQGARLCFDAEVAEGIRHFVPFSLGGTGIVVGQGSVIGITRPVRNVSVRTLDGTADVSWEWPSFAKAAVVNVSEGGAVVERRVLSVDDYATRGCRVALGARARDVEVSAAVPIGATLAESPPVRVQLPAEPAHVAYTVHFGFRKRNGRVHVTTAGGAGGGAVTVIAAPGTVMPLTPGQGYVLAVEQLPTDGRRELDIQFALPDAIRKPFWLRAFVTGGDAAIQHPPVSNSKVD